MVFVFIFSYFTPLLSDIFIERARKCSDVSRAFDSLKKAEALSPLNIKPFYFRTLLAYKLLAKSFDLDLYSRALTNIKKIQRLNKQFLPVYLLEADLNLEILRRNLKYFALENEIIGPLIRAEEISPYNPFIKLKKARIFLEFNHDIQAKKQAEKALELEPDFIAALYFLHEKFNYFDSEFVFKNRVNKVLARIKNLRLQPRTYLYKLFYDR
jgi:tetratricopeptide (TPR) repeat protein